MNCSKVMWVLTTNALDPIIMSFCAEHEMLLSDEGDLKGKEQKATELTKTLRAASTDIFTVSLSTCHPTVHPAVTPKVAPVPMSANTEDGSPPSRAGFRKLFHFSRSTPTNRP